MAGGDFEDDALGGAPLSTGSSDLDLINNVGDQSVGKHMLLMVPDFYNVAEAGTSPNLLVGTQPMNSYLRLGMADSRAGDAAQIALGEDLAAYVEGFTDDRRDRGDVNSLVPGALAPDSPTNAETPAPANTQYLPPTTTGTNDPFPVAESARLHQKGGWRDHSDGNRITTTRGDKIEVIRGNYKLLVLGRTDDIGNAVGFDMSGGQVDTDTGDLARPTAADLAAGAVSGLDVTWKWQQDTDGNFRWHVTTLQGGTGDLDNASGTGSNPTITTTTWAYDITSTTNANTVNTTVTSTGDNNTTTTSNNGAVTTNTSGASIQSRVSANSGSVTNDTYAFSGTITNTNGASTIVNNTNAALNILSDTTALAQESFQINELNLAGNLIGAQVQVNAGLASVSGSFFMAMINELAALINITNWNGMVLDAHQGLHADNHAGMHIDNHSGIHLDLHTGSHMSQDIGPKIDSLTGPQVVSIVGPSCHMLTQSLHLTEANQIAIAASYMRL
jgi:hypothetical protein